MNRMGEPDKQPDPSAGSLPTGPAAADRRLERGARARQAIARHAVDVASLHGLNGLSIGGLAADLGLSKSGIQTLFKTKENLQLATISSAHEQFTAAVILPALALPRGSARLGALIDRWITYAKAPLFAGGCFWAANIADFDSQPGPVHDALFRQHEDWIALLAGEVRYAADAGQITDVDAGLAAFQIDAVLTATNTALRLGDHKAVTRLRRMIHGILRAPS